MARLFYRLTSVARGWINEQMIPLSWAMIVTSQLRASYVSELVIQLREVKVVTNDDSLRIIEATTNAINQFDPDWFEILREGILQATKWTDEKLSAYFENSFVLTDALLYMQAGLPDKVMFVTNELRSRMESGED